MSKQINKEDAKMAFIGAFMVSYELDLEVAERAFENFWQHSKNMNVPVSGPFAVQCGTDLFSAFLWDESPEGFDYWMVQNNRKKVFK